MIKQIQAVPFYMTRGCDKFKEFLNKNFDYQHLFNSNEKLFDDWVGKDMITYYKCRDSNGNILEFYANKYIIKAKDSEFKLLLPETFDMFLTDMHRIGIMLYWHESVINNYSPKNILKTSEIHKYYFDLLTKMGKSNEIIAINNN